MVNKDKKLSLLLWAELIVTLDKFDRKKKRIDGFSLGQELGISQTNTVYHFKQMKDYWGFEVKNNQRTDKENLTPEGKALVPAMKRLLGAAKKIDEIAADLGADQES